MNIFDQLNDILFTKKKRCMSNIDDENNYVPYMINRWVSMYSPDHAMIINSTVNWMGQALETKLDHYNFLHSILPKSKWKRINYIKKVKEDKDEEDNKVQLLASTLELSEREVKYLLEQQV